MAISFTSFIFIWLLPITAHQMTTEMASLRLDTQVSGFNDTASTMAPVTPATDKTSTNPLLQATQTAAAPTNPTIPFMVSTTEAPPTTPTPTPTVSQNQSQGTGNMPSSQYSTHAATNSPLSSNLTSTTSTKSIKVTCTSPVTEGGGMAHSTNMGKNSLTTPTKKRQESPNNGKAVAGLIGGALVLMMVGFLLIYIKKQKLQKQQITTTDWAGPSPFLECGGDGGQVTPRSSNRFSLSSFLPQRLSKRLSLLPETDEELEDLTPGTTFGGKHQESSTICQETDGKGSNGTAAVDAEKKNTEDGVKTLENSEMSSQFNSVHKNQF